VVLRFSPKIAPVKCAIFPLLKNKPELVAFAKKLHADLSDDFIVSYDEGNIGKMYRRQDEVGTPYCVTVDFTTLEDGTVTVRDRDSMEQIRVPATQMEQFLREKIKGKK
jgi:glycyl-tRNA synthetase